LWAVIKAWWQRSFADVLFNSPPGTAKKRHPDLPSYAASMMLRDLNSNNILYSEEIMKRVLDKAMDLGAKPELVVWLSDSYASVKKDRKTKVRGI